MSDDIANRLRNKHADDLLAWEAADEIERLRNELDGSQFAYRGANYDRDRMRAERDEARREVCEWVAMMTKRKPSTAAKDRGWDCFKEMNQ